MAKRDTAEQQLERVLYLLPAAARECGARFEELERALGVPAKRVIKDLTEVADRAYYHGPGGAPETQILIEQDGVRLLSRGEFRRPPRLAPREAVALGLGLRALAAEAADDPSRRERLLALAGRLERDLAYAPISGPDVLADRGADGAGIRAAIQDASRQKRRCRIGYLKAPAAEPEEREIAPYALVFAGPWCYVLAHCARRQAIRRFRVDRVLAVEILDEVFEFPEGFRPADHIGEAGVFVASDPIVVSVRYSPRIARWIRERTPEAEEQADGSVVVRHEVADPAWLVRHVLQYGPDAEVVSPPEVRSMVAATVGRLLARA